MIEQKGGEMDKPMIEIIKEMTATELTEWLFNFGLNCVNMGKGDIYRMLMKGGTDDPNGR